MTETIIKGSTVTFTGFVGAANERPENAALLEEGKTYVVGDISDDDGNEVAYFLEAANPDFDDTKRASKLKNPKTKLVDVFVDEIELVAAEEQEELDLEGEEEQEETLQSLQRAAAERE